MATEGDTREQAIERIKRKRAFWSTAATFALIVTLLVVVWAVSGGGFFWPVFPAVGLAIALGFQAWGPFGGHKPITEDEIAREEARGKS